MNYFEAIREIQNNKRVSHALLTKHKWLRKSTKEGFYEYDDGSLVSAPEFWSIRRKNYAWTENWIVVE